MNKSLHATLRTICTSRSDPLLLSSLLKHTTHQPHAHTSTGWSPSMFSKCWRISVGATFSAWRNSVTHLSFTHTFMSDTILSDCPSAAICHMLTACVTKVQPLQPYHQHLPLMARAITIKWEALFSEQPWYCLPLQKKKNSEEYLNKHLWWNYTWTLLHCK